MQKGLSEHRLRRSSTSPISLQPYVGQFYWCLTPSGQPESIFTCPLWSPHDNGLLARGKLDVHDSQADKVHEGPEGKMISLEEARRGDSSGDEFISHTRSLICRGVHQVMGKTTRPVRRIHLLHTH
ncbi:hypothetical protein DPEC_G00041690 [Dallia pectoralis]|uniref:Uncharacterized protein n=1 Tax=Dallia pectoralis TaxID=75939 RepID=A0ACC2H9G0_DALPE|nr:hypothetical protein DPEC_G00041690 [Dallia pectoralis]